MINDQPEIKLLTEQEILNLMAVDNPAVGDLWTDARTRVLKVTDESVTYVSGYLDENNVVRWNYWRLGVLSKRMFKVKLMHFHANRTICDVVRIPDMDDVPPEREWLTAREADAMAAREEEIERLRKRADKLGFTIHPKELSHGHTQQPD